jgi:hypothetical protein
MQKKEAFEQQHFRDKRARRDAARCPVRGRMQRLEQWFEQHAAGISKQRSSHGYRRIAQPF